MAFGFGTKTASVNLVDTLATIAGDKHATAGTEAVKAAQLREAANDADYKAVVASDHARALEKAAKILEDAGVTL